MQYILDQSEYDQYCRFKKIATDIETKGLSSSNKMVYELYLNNPSMTYQEASILLGKRQSGIHRHVNLLCKLGYLCKDLSGKVKVRG